MHLGPNDPAPQPPPLEKKDDKKDDKKTGDDKKVSGDKKGSDVPKEEPKVVAGTVAQ